MAKLKDYSKVSVRNFLDALGAPTASPGGGSAAALVAATSCALLEMVAGINARRQKTEDRRQRDRLAKIRARLLTLMSEDVKVFMALKSELKKNPSGRKRDQIYLRAARPPLEICELSTRVARACERERKRTSFWLMSDWREAKILIRTAFYAAWLNVEVNLHEIKDQGLAKKVHAILKKLQSQVDAYAKNGR